jgi:hypothetical protein
LELRQALALPGIERRLRENLTADVSDFTNCRASVSDATKRRFTETPYN